MDPKEAERKGDGTLRYQEVALQSGVYLAPWRDPNERHMALCWGIDESAPHITQFVYEAFIDVRDYDEPDQDDDDDGLPILKKVGKVDGYIISHGGNGEGVDLLFEADSIDADIEAYVTCLKVELEACQVVSEFAPELEDFPRIVIVRHFEPAEDVDSLDMIVKVVAAVAMKEGPMLLMVDPREMPTEHIASARMLKGRTHTAILMQQLGLVRMICSLSVWGWHCSEKLMVDWHSYEDLVAAKTEGRLDSVLETLNPDME